MFGGPNRFFQAFSRPERVFLRVTPSRTSFPRAFRRPEGAFFNYFRALIRPRAARGAPKVRSAGSKHSKIEAQRGEKAVPTTIEPQKQENAKKRVPSRRELDFRGIGGVREKLFQAFSRSERVFSSFFERLAVPNEFFLAFSRPRRAFSSA